MDINRGGGDRYPVDPNAFHPYRHPPREAVRGPLLSRFPDHTPIIPHRGNFSGNLRPIDSSLSRYSEFEVPLTGQNLQFPLYDQTPPDRFGGSSYEPRNFNGVRKQSEGGNFTKLFVSSVPYTATENDIRPPFEEHGNVVEVALIRDTRTGQHQGCCFIKYATSEEADRAIRFLNNQYILPGGVGPIQVRYADREHERLDADEFTLFVSSLNKQATEKEVEDIFMPYGRVEDVCLLRDEMNQSLGCGFVKFFDENIATRAKNALNGIYTMKGCEQPLTVRFADLKKPTPGETRLPRLGESACHPVSQHGMVPSYDVGMHGIGNQGAPRNGDVFSAPARISSTVRPLGQSQLQGPNLVGQSQLQRPNFVGQSQLQRPNFVGQNQLQRPNLVGQSQLQRPNFVCQSQLQGPNFAGQSQTSFSQGLPLQPMRGFDKMLPHHQAQSSQQAFTHMQPLNPSLTPHQNLRTDRLQMTNNTNTGTNTPTFSLRLILEKDKLTGPNFLDWQRNLRIVLKQERKLYILDTPLGNKPPHNATQTVINAYEKHHNDSIDVSCLMLATMIPDLQKNMDNMEAYEMICTLQEKFQKKATRIERQKAIQALHTCKLVKGQSVGPHVMKMKGYVDQLDKIGYPVAQGFAIDMILKSLSDDYKEFVINYYKNNMDESILELHEMLKTIEKGFKPKAKKALMVKQGRVDKKPSKDKSKKVVGKPNKKPKPKPTPEASGKKPKDAECFHCNEIGHWKRNCPKYLEELRRNQASLASTSGVQNE